eukprot:tig00001127_g7163.t1
MSRILNVNVGVLGHVDSGKTSLVKALSTRLSTAALDKHPESRQRGITIDLGFSACELPVPEHLAGQYDALQLTLVDCPGHATLIRTVLGASAIIDSIILVVDVTKGIQTQTAECLVVGEVTEVADLVVVLNKADLFPPETRAQQVDKMKARIRKVLAGTRFAEAAFATTAACPGGAASVADERSPSSAPPDVSQLVSLLSSRARVPARTRSSAPFLFYVDHCFPIKGQGTVLTGTCLAGSIKVGDSLEIPSLKQEKKVKSIQVFRKPVQSIQHGDRAGVCVTQFPSEQMERGLACAPGSVPSFSACIAAVDKIRFFKGEVLSKKSKWHLTIGHDTVMATPHFFSEVAPPAPAAEGESGEGGAGPQAGAAPAESASGLEAAAAAMRLSDEDFFAREFHHYDALHPNPAPGPAGATGYPRSQHLLVGSRLDADVELQNKACRLAFSGRVLRAVEAAGAGGPARLRIFKIKERRGVVDRTVDDHTVIGRDLFKKETDIGAFVGLRVVRAATGAVGTIEGSFGKSGKFKVHFPAGGCEAAGKAAGAEAGALVLRYKRYAFDERKRMLQDGLF